MSKSWVKHVATATSCAAKLVVISGACEVGNCSGGWHRIVTGAMRPAGRPRLACGRAIGRAGRAVVAAGVAGTVACPMVCQGP